MSFSESTVFAPAPYSPDRLEQNLAAAPMQERVAPMVSGSMHQARAGRPASRSRLRSSKCLIQPVVEADRE
jgi:hypothetical protein